MFLVLLKIKNKIYFESLDTQESMVEFIDTVETKYGDIEYKKSVIIEGSDDDIEEIINTIEEHYYLHIVGRKIDEKVYKDLIALLQSLKLDVKITYGIEFEIEEHNEDNIPTAEEMGTLINTDSYDSIIQAVKESDEPTDLYEGKYTFYVYWFEDKVVFNLYEMDGFDASCSFRQTFDNLDEVMSLFEGLKHDFMEIITDETESSFAVTTNLTEVKEFIELKISLMQWKDTKPIKYLNGRFKQKKIDSTELVLPNHDYLTASEVMKKLRISDQTLANWRRCGLIDFKKISNRKYLYVPESVNSIFENGIDTTGVVTVVEQKQTISQRIEKPKQINYKDEILKILKPFAFKIPEYKYQKQNFFLNFGNVGISSSPQVMINDDFQLVDFIKKNVLKETPEELYEYLVTITQNGEEPRIDTSRKIQSGFSKFYLNKLFDKELVSP